MANTQLNFLVFLFLTVISLCVALTPKFVEDAYRKEHVKIMSRTNVDAVPRDIEKRSLENELRSHQHRSKRQTADAQCSGQETKFLNKISSETVKSQFAHQYTFPNESKYSIALVWAGENTGKILVTVTEEKEGLVGLEHLFKSPGAVYLSMDEGKSFENITKRLDNGDQVYIKRANGLQKNPAIANQMFIVAHGAGIDETDLYMTKDGAASFVKSTMPFTFSSNFVFHPTDPSHLLAQDNYMNLHVTTDYGSTWKEIKQHVVNYKWSSHANDPSDTIYVGTDENMQVMLGMVYPSGDSRLEKSTDGGTTWNTIHDDIITFGAQSHFLFASVKDKENDEKRFMEVSMDGGATWAEVQLPTITDDRFYSILDMTEGQVFMHVDDPGDTGVGTLYNSDATGTIFSKSLDRHLYPNFEDLTDFYKVESLRGVYISSQLQDDLSIRSMITRDRGGEWFPIRRPDGVPCHDETKECYLQIHNKYSVNRGISGSPPKSVASAVGIIMVHGHVASSLQTTNPDVFVSSDGGYSWKFALSGPHHYEIADQGGLLVAVPSHTTTPNTVKFSTDEGQCWHEYKFTDETIVFTGLLTEPGNKAMSVAIWGYGQQDKNWRVHTVDFEKVIENKCIESDYVTWTAHSDNANQGCLLGQKETFQRLQPDSWCLNGQAREITKDTSICECTKADYDCDYGYIRNTNQDCVVDPLFKSTSSMDICKRGHLQELVYVGYHLVPGDKCQSGFAPSSDTMVDLKKHCKEGDKSIVANEEGIEVQYNTGSHKHRVTVGILVTVALVAFLSVAILTGYIVRKYRSLKQSKLIYRYSAVRSQENEADDLERALAAHTSIYDDSSDDDQMNTHPPTSVPTVLTPQPASQLPAYTPVGIVNGSFSRNNAPVTSYHDDSDEDMLE